MGGSEAGGDLLVGAAQPARNWTDTSIHDPETAERLGFRGAAVAASVHLDLFPPLLLDAFGPRWFESGSLSLYFETVVVDGERVEAVVEVPGPGVDQVRAWGRFAGDDHRRVAAGTASVGPLGGSELRTRDLRLGDPSELRLLRGLAPGQVLEDATRFLSSSGQLDLLARGLVSEPLPWYSGHSPWGGPVATPFTTVGFLHHGDVFGPWAEPGTGMFGAIELAQVEGPLLLDRDYRVHSVVVGVGQSPRTEYCWWDSTATDEGGRTVVAMRHLQRYLKSE